MLWKDTLKIMNFLKKLFDKFKRRRTSVKAWHFLKPDKRLNHRDGRLVELGVPIRSVIAPSICVSGLHASLKALDAYRYCNWGNPIACRVVLRGKKEYGPDKLCAEERTVIGWCETTDILHELACRVAEDLLIFYYKRDKKDKTIKESLDVVRLAIVAKRDWLANNRIGVVNTKFLSGKQQYAINRKAPDLMSVINGILHMGATESFDRVLEICKWDFEYYSAQKQLQKYNKWFERMLTVAMVYDTVSMLRENKKS